MIFCISLEQMWLKTLYLEELFSLPKISESGVSNSKPWDSLNNYKPQE